jgi:pimeloyl-ACP methyl ester carboxylesterase
MPVDLVSRAVLVLQAGDRASARLLLAEALRQRPNDEQAWLWLSGAIESDDDRLNCLQRVLSINPTNQAALAGIQTLSRCAKAEGAKSFFPGTAEASLEAFLSEQEKIHSINPPHTRKPVSPAVVLPDPMLEQEFPIAEAAMPLQSAPVPPIGPALQGLLEQEPCPGCTESKKPTPPLIPWHDLPFSKEQVLLFVLGLIIVFLVLLIGFSILKTVLHGPRILAAPAALPTPSALPTSMPQPTPLIFQPTVVSADCRFDVPDQAQVECLTIILPESRDGSSVRSVRLPLVIYHSLNPFPPPDPVIYLHGGPGASAIEWAAANFEIFIGPLLYERDVIVYDGRGFGQATPALDCPELLNQFQLELRQEPSPEYRIDEYGPAVKSCRDRLASQGIRLSQFSTAAMAADVYDIVQLLGYEQVNLLGVSFGASVAQVVLRDYPDILRSVVLDSAFPLQGIFYNEIASGTERALQELFEACKVDSACRSQYPNLEVIFTQLSSKLGDAPIGLASASSTGSLGARLVIDDLRFQEALRLTLLSPDLIPDIPRGLYALRSGDLDIVETALSSLRMSFTDPSLGVMQLILCSEQAYATTPADLEMDLDAYPRTAELARYSLYGSRTDLFEICELWQAAPFDPLTKQLPNGDTPTLILSGRLDPLSSPDLLAGLEASLEQAKLLYFPGLGHGVSIGEGGACPLSIAIAFLHDPDADVQAGCMGEMRFRFTER